MEDIYWKTEEPLNDNNFVMNDYLENINMLDITFVDGTYAEGVNAQGDKFEIHASGNGDFFNHKIEFKVLFINNKE